MMGREDKKKCFRANIRGVFSTQSKIYDGTFLQRYKSSHRRSSVKKGVLRIFAKFTGKHLCHGLFLNKVAGLKPATLLKRDSGRVVFL